MTESLAEAIQKEITVARQKQDEYKEIAKMMPLANITVQFIEFDIQFAIKALAEGDVINCLTAYKALQAIA